MRFQRSLCFFVLLTCVSLTAAAESRVEVRADANTLLLIVDGKTVAIVPGSIYLAGDADPKPPVDKLAAELAEIFAADTSPAKRVDLGKLAEVYKAGSTYAADESFGTVADVLALMRDATKGVTDGALPKLRERLAEELRAQLRDPAAKLDPELRAKLRELLRRIAALLLGLL